MSLSARYTNHPVKLHTATAQSAGAVNVQGVRSVGLSMGLATRAFKADGSVYATYGSLVSGAPTATFETVDLKVLLDECGLTGMEIDSDGTHPGVVLYLQRHAANGTRDADASTTHISYTFENGLMVPRTLSLSHQDPAGLTVEVIPIATSSVDPVAFNEAVALPTLTEAVSNMWTLGKVDLNGTELAGVDSLTLNFGINAQALSRDSDIYPTHVSIESIMPTISLTTNQVNLTSTLTEEGAYYTAGQVIFYAKHYSEGGTYVADGTATHMSFSLGKCRVQPESIEGDPKRMRVLITPWASGATAPVTINTATAIS